MIQASYVSLPFKISQRDSRPLSHFGLFFKGASILFYFQFWVFSKIIIIKSDCPVFCGSNIGVLLHKNVYNMHPLAAKHYDKNFVCQFFRMRYCGGCDFKLL